jgi:hypothetical protein
MAVIIIIGIIITLILITAMDGVRRAEERATQSLIIKLETGLNDRLEALLQTIPAPNYAHGYLAGVYPQGFGTEQDNLPTMLPSALMPPGPGGSTLPQTGLPNPACKSTERAQVIAAYDYIKAELPDVFFVQNNQFYPINFTGIAFPGAPVVTNSSFPSGSYILPLGHMVTGPRVANNLNLWAGGFGDSHIQTGNEPNPGYLYSSHPELGQTGSGINGASYAAAAGLYKNLGYAPTGYDMVDNDGNGLIDDWAEGTLGLSNQQVQAIQSNLAAHTHATARAEMLYAILVEGLGPLGSVFSRDDFTDKEVRDTDGDGLPEFVDAWGNPIQFFRWPILYHSDLQRGQTYVSQGGSSWQLTPPYANRIPVTQNSLEPREQGALDTNQELVAPGWWATATGSLAANGAFPNLLAPTVTLPVPAGASLAPRVFGTFFHRLTEPYPAGATGPVYWDRSGNSFRRAFFTKFLILSGGPDGVPGVFLYNRNDLNALPSPDSISAHLIANENVAMPFSTADVDFTANSNYAFPGFPSVPATSSLDPTHPATFDLFQGAQDDITNQNLEAVGGVGGSG